MRLNYKHLRYFYAVAESLSIKEAARRLNLTPQTISGQLKMLEDELGEALFRKSGRGLELTEAGQVALEYCNEIFRLGDELQEVLHQGLDSRAEELRVGIVDALPKSIAQRILAPLLKDSGNMRLICREEQMTALLGELAVHRLDLVLADSPIPPGMNIRCFNHVLARSTIACFAAPQLIRDQPAFPQCLQDAPVLLPTDASSALRTNLLSWLQRQQIKVRIAGEFDDSALMKAFGSEGHGYFFAPQIVTAEICARYGVKVAGLIPELEQTVYGIVAERRMTHSAVRELTRTALEH
tara:strand:- start:1962 stop:2849 length:888 start_codon:yes stop_codon:yes gene_type:complete